MSQPRVLILVRDPQLRSRLQAALRGRFLTAVARNEAEAFDKMFDERPDAVVTALGDLADTDPRGSLFTAHPEFTGMPLIVIGEARTRTAVMEAARRGASDFILKTELTPALLTGRLARFTLRESVLSR